MSADTQNYSTQAQLILALLPPLRNWVTSRVHVTGADRGISLRQLAALRGIEDGATSPGELARLWQVTPAVITGIVDRLERRNLVWREVDPQDRRRLRLALTDDGRAACQEIETALVEDLAAQLALATPKELAELGRSLELLQRTFAALEAKAPALVPSSDDENPLWIDEDDDPKASAHRERALIGATD